MKRFGWIFGIMLLGFTMIVGSAYIKAQEKPLSGDKRAIVPVADVVISIKVPRETKITIDDKVVPYDKFETLMEYASTAFEVEDITFKEGKFAAIKFKKK